MRIENGKCRMMEVAQATPQFYTLHFTFYIRPCPVFRTIAPRRAETGERDARPYRPRGTVRIISKLPRLVLSNLCLRQRRSGGHFLQLRQNSHATGHWLTYAKHKPERKCARAEGVGLAETEGRAAKRSQEPARRSFANHRSFHQNVPYCFSRWEFLSLGEV